MSQAMLHNDSGSNGDALLTALGDIVGHENVRIGDSSGMSEQYAIDGVVPKAIVFPASESEVAKVLAYADETGLRISPRGGGTQTGLGNIPSGVDVVVSLERLNRIVAHEPADMTVTVQAGLSLAKLQSALAEAGQFLPVDPPLPAETTVGGILATRAFGPLRFGYRTISDFLLGIKVVTAQGQIAKAGGRVVKNVSGYELGRLYTGSMGTLALIVEATFKVQPLPRRRSILIMPCSDMTMAQQYVRSVIECGVQPMLFELIAPFDLQSGLGQRIQQELAQSNKQELNRQTAAILAVGFMGTDEEVAWQIEKSRQTLNSLPTPPTFVSPIEWNDAYPQLIEAHKGLGDQVITCRVHMKDTQLYAYLERLLHNDDSMRDGRIAIAAHAGSGVARLHIPIEPSGKADHQLNALREQAEAVGGRLIIEKAPLWIKQNIDVWGTPGADLFLHQAVKDKMDPKRLLNPGRFIGGI